MLENLKNFNLQNFFDITSIVDIVIVAFVLYRLMLLIKGTRALQLIKGLVVLLVATAVSNWLQLFTLHWLLKQAMTALVVALPIVFQPELRRALEKLGGGAFFAHPLNNVSEDARDRVVKEIVRAVQAMSRTRTGALIVIERITGLEEYMESGTPIGGLVSAEFLENVFVPKTPLHDGAVIIRGERVMAAACVLPLTESVDLGKELGTRHRAAIGITEVSDALALVVSEETGTISLSVEGVLARHLDDAALADRLAGALEPKQGHALPLKSLWQRR